MTRFATLDRLGLWEISGEEGHEAAKQGSFQIFKNPQNDHPPCKFGDSLEPNNKKVEGLGFWYKLELHILARAHKKFLDPRCGKQISNQKPGQYSKRPRPTTKPTGH